MITGLIEIVVIPSILFVVGLVITQRFLAYKKWENSVFITLVINAVWLFLDIGLLSLVFANFVDNSLSFNIITSVIGSVLNLGVGILISRFIFKKDLKESLKTIGFLQIAWLVIWLYLGIIPDIFNNLMITGLIEIVIIPGILFVIGLVITQRFLAYKKWENSVFITLVINAVWLFLDIGLLYLVFANFVDNSLMFNIITSAITCALNLCFGILISGILSKKDLKELLKTIGFIQIAWLVIWMLLSTVPDIINIFMITENENIESSRLIFIGALFFLFGISIFSAYWG